MVGCVSPGKRGARPGGCGAGRNRVAADRLVEANAVLAGAGWPGARRCGAGGGDSGCPESSGVGGGGAPARRASRGSREAAPQGGPRRAKGWGAGRAEPTLPGRSTPSWPGAAKSTNRAASCAVFACLAFGRRW